VADSKSPAYYEIRIEEALDVHWSNWFDGLEVRNDGGETVIYGLLTKRRCAERLQRFCIFASIWWRFAASRETRTKEVR
jgi:hypothetical protein